jgi:hypothetical protein
MHGGDHERASTAEARRRLIAELERTVESVLESAEAEGRRKALERADLGRLRRLSADVLARATELDREIARLTDQAAQTAEVPEAAEAAATIDDPASDWRPAHPPAYADTTLDDVEASRASLAGAGTGSGATRRRFRRRSRDTGDIPEGVRLAVVQMRLAGEADAAIARYLTEMGVDDPDAVISRIET